MISSKNFESYDSAIWIMCDGFQNNMQLTSRKAIDVKHRQYNAIVYQGFELAHLALGVISTRLPAVNIFILSARRML